MNQACISEDGGLLEITSKVPLIKYFYLFTFFIIRFLLLKIRAKIARHTFIKIMLFSDFTKANLNLNIVRGIEQRNLKNLILGFSVANCRKVKIIINF